MVKIGIVGASGFVGNRAVEMLQSNGHQVRPIVRNASRLAPFITQNLEGYVANAFDQSALEKAFHGCDVVIHSVLGSPGLIRGSVAPAYRAAQKAGVRRLIYLSSMIVHTSAPAPGTTESTPPIEHQPGFPTHVAKIEAERRLLRMRRTGQVEVVIFRPGIVFGPRSRWVRDLASQLTQGTAYLINDGQGVCNSVYVDNLIHGMQLAMTTPAADGEAFFVGDRERITWLDFYQPFALALGINPAEITRLPAPQFTHSRQQEFIRAIRESEFVQKGLALISDQTKQHLKRLLTRHQLTAESPSITSVKPEPVVSEMMAILQQSQYQLPYDKAKRLLGYEPIVSFEEGCRRSIEWLQTDPQVPLAIGQLSQP